MKNEIVKLGKLEIDLRALTEFIAKAKKRCYAGSGKEERAEDGSKVLTFQEGDFHYTDNYDGFYQAPGSEIVRWQKSNGQRIWKMSYSGGMFPQYWGDEGLAKETFAFLKRVLQKVRVELPFRGPIHSEEDSEGILWTYTSFTVGIGITRFSGKEEIHTEKEIKGNPLHNKMVFAQDYIGGLIIPK
jgi:hypothetical protein